MLKRPEELVTNAVDPEASADEMKKRFAEPAKGNVVKVNVTKSAEPKPESRAERSDRENYIRRGQEAWARHNADTTWNDWLAIGEAIGIGSTEAMNIAGKNEPKGKGYNTAFSVWLKDHGFDGLDGSDRKRLLDVLAHRAEIEEWRSEKLTPTERRKINHPSTVWRRWTAYIETPAQKKARKEKREAKQKASSNPLFSPTVKKLNAKIEQQAERITEVEQERDDAIKERDEARQAEWNSNGKPLTIDALAEALVKLLKDESASVARKKVKAFVSRVQKNLPKSKK
jgi:hypothetical protein